jgi:hypothetical protein
MPLSKQEVLARKQQYYEENRDTIKAKNLQRYHAKQAELHGGVVRPRGRPRLVFPDPPPNPENPPTLAEN